MANTTLPAKNILDGTKSPKTDHAEMAQAQGENRDFLAEVLGASGDAMLTPQCIFKYNTVSECRLYRYAGKRLPLYNATTSKWEVHDIDASGIVLANSDLAADNTDYFVYAYLNAGVPDLQASATAYTTDTNTGLQIKSGAATHLLVGMVRKTGGNFGENDAVVYVRSYYNRQAETYKRLYDSPAADKNITDTSFPGTELDTAVRLFMLLWADETLEVQAHSSVSNSSAGFSSWMHFTVNSSDFKGAVASGDIVTPLSITEVLKPSQLNQGLNTVYLKGYVSGGTATYRYSTADNTKLTAIIH